MARNFDLGQNHHLASQNTAYIGPLIIVHLGIHPMQPSNQQPKNQAGNFSNAPNSCTSLQIMTAWI